MSREIDLGCEATAKDQRSEIGATEIRTSGIRASQIGGQSPPEAGKKGTGVNQTLLFRVFVLCVFVIILWLSKS